MSGLRLGHEYELKRLVDMCWNGIPGDRAALFERCDQAALRAHDLAGPRQGDMRFKPSERLEAEALCCGLPLRFVRRKIDPLTVANLVEPQLMGEVVRHSRLPSAILVPSSFSSPDQKSRRPSDVRVNASEAGSDL